MLQQFYHEQAKKFAHTRKRPRPEFKHILRQIILYVQNQDSPKPLQILELGCGDGRFARYLREHLEYPYYYTGVDFSQGSIAIAEQQEHEYFDNFQKKENTKKSTDATHRFVVKSLQDYLVSGEQESIDIVISIASFQHLMHYKERLFVGKHLYRVLRYQGMHISTNRCYSQRFKKKFAKPIRIARLKRFFSFGYYDRHNLVIPFITPDKIYQRPYHIFRQEEWLSYSKKIACILTKFYYIAKSGERLNLPDNARNSFTVQQKNVFITSS